MLGRLAGSVQRGQGAPVEGPIRTHHDVTPVTSPFPRQLNGALIGFGTAIAEENPASTSDKPVQSSRHFLTRLRPEQVGRMQQGLGGGADRLRHDRVSVAEGGYREPGEEIDVPAPVLVPKVRALAAHERDAGSRISRHQMGHWTTIVPMPLRVKISSRRA